MKLSAIILENFRAYEKPTKLEFEDLTTIIGRNDIGKSSILEALEIFFDGGTVKIEQADVNVRSNSTNAIITIEFTDLPDKITLDAGAMTTLAEEYLLSSNGTLVIRKIYDCSKNAPSSEAFIIANHPTAKGVNNLLELKEKGLQELVRDRGLDVPLKGNPGMRKALWQDTDDLALAEVPIPVSKPKEDSKRIWEQIELHLPMFALFQSDRQSRDSDGEVQNPLKGAVASAIAEVHEEIESIQAKVREKSEEIADLTHKALQTIDPNLANALSPKFTPPTPAKWIGLFSLGLDTDDGIPLNKRGSGVRRLILVSFFKAEAERKLASSSKANVIYALEEPETSQHPTNQRILIKSFIEIANAPNCQVILTTHSPGLAADLPIDSIRFISRYAPQDTPSIKKGADVFGLVADTLGITPDSRVKVFICVEGPTDIEALRQLSHALHLEDPTIPDLLGNPRCTFICLGGSTIKHWVEQNYLEDMRRPEVHIYDSDVQKYAEHAAEVNGRDDGLDSWATLTTKHEIECYLHPDAIQEEFEVVVDVVDHPTDGRPSVPEAFSLALSERRGWDQTMGDAKSKRYLTQAFGRMTANRIRDRDPNGEVEGWFRKIGEFF